MGGRRGEGGGKGRGKKGGEGAKKGEGGKRGEKGGKKFILISFLYVFLYLLLNIV